MSETLWDRTAGTLLSQTASAAPTPGGGAVAALTAAFGFGLLEMAIAVTLSRPADNPPDTDSLKEAGRRAGELRAVAVTAADQDVADFEALMTGYRMPRESEREQAARAAVIDAATVIATDGPLGLAEAAIAGIDLGERIEPLVAASIVSDVQAGRDLLRGAALAALATADINLGALERSGHTQAPSFRARRDAARRSASKPEPAR